MDIVKLLKEFPTESAALIATTSALLGWVGRNIFQLIVENWRYNKELRTFFWKEKINAAKKASEFYLENLNFLNLVRVQFELYENGKLEHQMLIQSIEKEVSFYREKLKSFPHFEHHHINIFYDFNENRSLKLTTETMEIQQKIHELISDTSISSEQFDSKIKEYSKNIKDNYSELFNIHKCYLKKVREDIGKYP